MSESNGHAPAEDTADDTKGAFRKKLDENPYAFVGAAIGLGYVLGGGLFTPTTARLIRLGMRAAAVPMVRDRLMEVAEATLDGVISKLPPK